MTVLLFAKPIKNELYDYFYFSANTPSSSAFIQARDKILPFAFESLFHKVNASFPYSKTFHGFRLITVDGSDLPISYDPNDTETLQGVSDAKYILDRVSRGLSRRYNRSLRCARISEKHNCFDLNL